VELTGPYFHTGGKATLRQVVNFYNRGGDFARENIDDLDVDIRPLHLSERDKDDLVAFLLSLTDQRVKNEKAPFDHPQLCIPNGQEGTTTSVTNDPANPGQATDDLQCLPAVGGAGGATPLRSFLNLNPFDPGQR
jgi:hypothetical protein